MATKLVRDLAGSSDLKLLMEGSDASGWVLSTRPAPRTGSNYTAPVHGTATASGNGTAIPAPGAGVSIVLDGITVYNTTSGTASMVKFTNGTAAGSVLAHAYLPNQGDGLCAMFPASNPPRCDPNTSLIINLSVAINAPYTIIYHTE